MLCPFSRWDSAQHADLRYGTGVRLTDFWDRMEQALGSSYARSWASDFRLSALDGRSVNEALAAGEDTLVVWRAVHQALNLEAKYR